VFDPTAGDQTLSRIWEIWNRVGLGGVVSLAIAASLLREKERLAVGRYFGGILRSCVDCFLRLVDSRTRVNEAIEKLAASEQLRTRREALRTTLVPASTQTPPPPTACDTLPADQYQPEPTPARLPTPGTLRTAETPPANAYSGVDGSAITVCSTSDDRGGWGGSGG